MQLNQFGFRCFLLSSSYRAKSSTPPLSSWYENGGEDRLVKS
ncbi:hypothetical protein V6Z12_D02G140700 [Gossypium hirsutum]